MKLVKIFVALGLGLLTSSAPAQQAIVNLPSADLTPVHRTFLMNESFVDPGVLNTVNFFTYGISEEFEFAATSYDLGKPQKDSLAVAVGYKGVHVLDEELQLKLTHGVMLPWNLRGQGLGVWGYSHVSLRLPATKTRLTSGLAAGTSQYFGQPTLCYVGAVEQPLTSELSLVTEWYSGRHAAGNLIAGFVYHNHAIDLILVAAYKIPNDPTLGRNGLVFEIGGFLP